MKSDPGRRSDGRIAGSHLERDVLIQPVDSVRSLLLRLVTTPTALLALAVLIGLLTGCEGGGGGGY